LQKNETTVSLPGKDKNPSLAQGRLLQQLINRIGAAEECDARKAK
jgi:hypothetical protein